MWQVTNDYLDLEELFDQITVDTQKWVWSKAAKHYMGVGLRKGQTSPRRYDT
jgi:hypothetical protein